MDLNPYPLRAHHGLCLCFFQGKGYSAAFVENMAAIRRELMNDVPVRITATADMICRKCPHDIDGQCFSAQKVEEYDRRVLAACRLSEGAVMPFSEFHRLVRRLILDAGKREEICGDCQWNEICGR